MSIARFLLFTGLGVAAVLLLTSDRAKELRNTVDDNAKRMADRLKAMNKNGRAKLADLKETID
jgi:Skp family chaperone for outer membrane proteins